MKLILTLTALAGLSACALSDTERRALADVAITQIAALNAQGIDPVTLEPDQLAILSAGCAFAPAFYPEAAGEIADACMVIEAAAQ